MARGIPKYKKSPSPNQQIILDAIKLYDEPLTLEEIWQLSAEAGYNRAISTILSQIYIMVGKDLIKTYSPNDKYRTRYLVK